MTSRLRRHLRFVLRGAIAGVALLVCAAVISGGALLLTGHRPVVIQTGSMGDTAPPGSLLVARPSSTVDVGDVLVMRTEGRATVTHRVVDLETRPDGIVAVTRGDANPDIDPQPYALSESELTARWVVPNAGGWLLQVRNPLIGLTLLIGVVGSVTFVALRRIWVPRSPAPATPGPVPALPRSRHGVRAAWRAETGRRRRALVIATAAGTGLVVGGAAFSLYLGVDSVDANSFATRPCFDARLGSVQTGQHVNDTTGTSTVAITAVDPSKSFVITSVSSASSEPDDAMISVQLASPTSLEFVRNTDAPTPPDVIVEWSVIEYDCGVSVQRGTASSGGSDSFDIAVAPVDTARSFALLSQGVETGASTFGPPDTATIELTSSTNVRIRTGASGSAATPFAWQVVTFDGGDASTQQLSSTLTATDTTVNVPLPTTVDPRSTALFVSARLTGSGTDIGDRFVRARLIDGDTVELSRSIADDTLDVVVQVVEFADGTTVRHGTLDLGVGEATGVVSIPPVQPSRSTVSSTVQAAGGLSVGSTTHVADDTIGEATARFVLTDERTVEVRRDATTSAASFAWQVITWNGPNWADLDMPFRQRIEVTGGSVVTPTGYTTPLTLDHASLVDQELSLIDGTDLRIWRHDGVSWTELHRVLDDESAWNDPATTFWFRTQEPIAADDAVSYWLYFGDETPAAALDDPAQVWLSVEGFDDGTLGVFEDRTGGTGWYDDDPWTRRVPITIDGVGLSTDVDDATVLVRITDSDLTTHARADGDDFRFTAADGTTPLPHHIESWDLGSDTLTAWVRLPSISTGASTTIHLYYGSPTAPDRSDARATWGGRAGAWLLADDPATTRPAFDDDGPRQRDGVALADATAGSSPSGPGVSLDGSLDRLESPPFALADAPFTVSTHVRVDTLGSDVTLLAQGDPTAGGVFDVRLRTGSNDVAATLATTDGAWTVTGGTISTGTWQLVVVTWDRSTLRLAVDGAVVATQTTTGGIVRPGAIPLTAGADPAGSEALDGILGHVEVSESAWDAAAIDFAADRFAGSRLSVGAPTATTAFEMGTWAARWPIVVDADSVAGTLTDFPLLVRLTDADVAGRALPSGADLVFTADDGVTRLDHWVEAWDDTTGELTAWVRVPTLDSTADTTLYLYAGNATATSQDDPEAVWGNDTDLVVAGAP